MDSADKRNIKIKKILHSSEFSFIKEMLKLYGPGVNLYDEENKLLLSGGDGANGERIILPDADMHLVPVEANGVIYCYISNIDHSSPLIKMMQYLINSELVKKNIAVEILARYRELHAISNIHYRISSNLRDYMSIGDIILEELSKIIPFDSAAIKIFNKDSLEFDIISSLGEYSANGRTRKFVDEISKKIMLSGKPQILNNIKGFGFPADDEGAPYSIICSPLIAGGSLLGTIELSSTKKIDYTSVHLMTINNISISIALVLKLSMFYDFEKNLLERQYADSLDIIESRKAGAGFIDALTGLYNRRKMLEIFSMFLSSAKRYSKDLSVAMIDIDNFRSVNEIYGKEKGNAVLSGLSSIISGCIKNGAVAGRWGGDEFIIVYPETDVSESVCSIKTIMESLSSAKFGDISGITCSFGLASCEKKDSIETILDKAEVALYEAKSKGKNCISLWKNKIN